MTYRPNRVGPSDDSLRAAGVALGQVVTPGG
ncbi:MAG: hypothetical protein QOE52_5575 [Mycobacterium sp.]|jgi:hypothetical protein|nr:hypothetical protein [Mycobacterium sp.]MDT7740016.1 hypothetical protein [Mycobacterium sp.]